MNIEQVAALNPDLILAVNDFGLELDYPKLSQIAPTVGYATEWGKQSWQEQAMVDARALGLEERGRQVVAETEAAIRAVRDANPSLVGKTVTYSFAYEPGKIVTLKSDQDPSVKLLQELGMQLPTSVRQLPDIAPGNPGGNLSFENMSVLDADIVIMLYATNELQRQVEGLKLFRSLRGVRDDRYIVINLPTTSALRTPTVLSIRWGLDQIKPSLARGCHFLKMVMESLRRGCGASARRALRTGRIAPVRAGWLRTPCRGRPRGNRAQARCACQRMGAVRRRGPIRGRRPARPRRMSQRSFPASGQAALPRCGC